MKKAAAAAIAVGFFDDDGVDGDGELGAEFVHFFEPLGRGRLVTVKAVGVVPEVLRLPEVYIEGQFAESAGDQQCVFHAMEALRKLVEGEHGALHSLVYDVAEELLVESDLVGFC